ncbi:hypothetical protein M378DRAFT_166219 [Amanita muscaria Koide BX008]|uniref:Uncharacterized protein n=1 Tax=Amanita muscaria (strain Koide BX008) TaxID=946122 RepID=A0A0C2SG53_AMAMK|nr:hypothetical protein M378DRAFT_166219 [Amanita muscaria Koide BX008]
MLSVHGPTCSTSRSTAGREGNGRQLATGNDAENWTSSEDNQQNRRYRNEDSSALSSNEFAP